MIPIVRETTDRQDELAVISCAPRGAATDRWKPPVELTKKEQLIMKSLNRVRPLFGFLR